MVTTLTLPQVAERLGVHRSTVYTLIAQDGLPVIYIRPRCPRVLVEEFDAWIARRPGASPVRASVPTKYVGARKRGPMRRAA
jgi:excisionase family DNA binding protein